MNSTPVAASVLDAALVEGALTFIAKHAQNLKLGVMGSKDFDRDPTTWKIDDLVKSAAAGQESAILDESSRRRTEALIRARNRIRAGRMLSDFPSGVVPDLRPEEATADLVVRRVLDWLQRYPPSGT
jgi:hypothetical protein